MKLMEVRKLQPQMTNNIQMLIGDVRETLKTIPDNSVNCCISSPPYYGLRSYVPDTAEYKCDEIGIEQSPEEFIENLVNVFREVRRVLTDDGVCFINIGDSYYNYRPGKGQALVQQGLDTELRGKPQECARRANRLVGLKEKDLIGIPWMLAFALRNDGWYLRQDIIWAKACSGVYSGGSVMPESTKDRFCRSHEYIFMLTKSSKYFFNIDAVSEKVEAINRIYSNNNMENRKGKGDEQFAINGKNQDAWYAKARERIAAGEELKRNRRSVWTVQLRPSKVSHYATYPSELIEPCILAGCPENGVVLDPFGGSGTTAVTATILGRNAIHCDLDPRTAEYLAARKIEIIKQRNSDGETISNGKIVKVRKLF